MSNHHKRAMNNLMTTVESFILDPKYADYLAILKAARNGGVYGAKVRFPHALVMVFLFRSGSYREKARLILKATRQHARNLATFAAIYKTVMLVLRSTSSTCKEAPLHAFLAGLIGGFLVFGRGIQSSVNQQIVIYVFARAVLSLAKLTMQIPSSRGITTRFNAKMSKHAWPIFASLSWATIMWVFRWYPQTVQPSLRSSMKYIYVNADHWDSFRNFLIFNT